MDNIRKLLLSLCSRLNERSTWLLIGAGVASAAALAAPWSYVAAVVGVLAALVPDGAVAGGSQTKTGD